MMRIYCFTGSGHSLAVAEALSKHFSCEIENIDGSAVASCSEVAVVVFPVYCQNIPNLVKQFLRNSTFNYVMLVTTYGKISYGNVLYEAQKLIKGKVIGGAYIPIGHTFLHGDCSFDTSVVNPIIERIKVPMRTIIPKTWKNPFANLFPELRSRISVKISRNHNCNNCGLCEAHCPVHAIKDGKTDSRCIRCLRCVTNCPKKALEYKNSKILEKYLTSRYKNDVKLFL